MNTLPVGYAAFVPYSLPRAQHNVHDQKSVGDSTRWVLLGIPSL